MVKALRPGQTIGIIGGGQLGRMLAIAAKQMGFKIAVLDPTPNSPTGQIADQEIIAQYDDLQAAKQLLEVSDIITYEFENVDADVCKFIESFGVLPQGSELIKITQDRAFEKEAIKKSGANVAPYQLVDHYEQLRLAAKQLSYPIVLKTRRGGYDGKGQFILRRHEHLLEAKSLLDESPCIVEKFIDFDKEISVIVSRSINGEMTSFPVAENNHYDHVLLQSIVPAQIGESTEKRAKQLAEQLAESIGMVGTLGVEMFLTHDGKLYINEVAPRPHNSGHYTMEACQTSQFEQHIRAICGFNLGSTELDTPVVMMNILGEHYDDVLNKIPAIPNAKLHIYGKEDVKQKRKMGHINFLAKDIKETLEQIKQLNIWRELE